MWQKKEDGEKNYEEALSYCQELDLAGHSDWRLPTKEELVAIASIGSSGLIEQFPDLEEDRYWAGTSMGELSWAENPAKIAYTVDFDPSSGNYKRPITYFRTYSYNVRAVRSG